MFRTSISYSEIWKIAYPIILGSIVHNIIAVTDTAFLGRVGEVELGAAAIGGVFYMTLIMLGFGFTVGTQIIVARRVGEKRQGEIGSIIEHSHYFLVFLSLVLILIVKSAMPFIFEKALDSQSVRIATQEYMDYRIYGLFFACINFGFRAFYIGISRTKVITWTTIFMALVNVFLDYALIFGKFGFPVYGIAGAAIASVVAEVSALIFFVFYTLKVVDVKLYGLFKFQRFSLSEFKKIFSVSMPMMIQNFISVSGWFIFFLLIEKMGEHSLAISNLIRSIYVVMLIPIWGFTSAVNTLVSFLMGSERTDEVIAVIVKTLKLSLVGVVALVLINLFFPVQILSIYTNNNDLIVNSLPALRVVSIAAIFLTIGYVIFSGVSGAGMTKVSLGIETVSIIFYVLITYLLANVLKTNIDMVWVVEIYFGLIMGIISTLYLKFGNWKTNRI